MKIKANFKLIGVIAAILLFMGIMYGYNRAERRKLAKAVNQGGAHHIEGHMPQHLQEQQRAMNAYKRPNIGTKKGGGCSVCSGGK